MIDVSPPRWSFDDQLKIIPICQFRQHHLIRPLDMPAAVFENHVHDALAADRAQQIGFVIQLVTDLGTIRPPQQAGKDLIPPIDFIVSLTAVLRCRASKSSAVMASLVRRLS